MEHRENNLYENKYECRVAILDEDKCDQYDYLIAVACGVIGSMVDIFLVGSARESVLGKWTDAQVDNAVKRFAKLSGWSPKDQKTDSVVSAIGFLEKKFKVNYDQRHSTDVNNLFAMSTKNHHMMSLAHSPDIVGLFFSILNQFTSTASFVSHGQLITINTETFEVQGNNFISKVFCGITNWLGHIMSDIAGSSGSRGNAGRGTGVVIPFYELFGFFKFGKFSVEKDKQDLAVIATRAFQEGYDFRFGLTTAIPVIITDLSIRLVWALRKHFQYGKSIKECIPVKKYADLRIMLIFGNGTLCVIDGVDAGIRSGGNFLAFFMRLNLIAWFKFSILVLKEVCIRLEISDQLRVCLESYRRINEALLIYLQELEKIDIQSFKYESEEYNKVVMLFENTSANEDINKILIEIFDTLNFNKPWKGDFNEHMSNRNAALFFE